MASPVPHPWHMPRVTIFLAVIEHGTITAAANALGLTKSAVSTHIRKLEAVCEARLFERSTRALRLTAAGADLQPHARRLVEAWAAGLDELQARLSEPTGTLRLTAPSILDRPILMAAIAAYTARYAKVEVVVRFSDVMLDVIGEQIDVAVRMGRLPDSELVARKLGEDHQIVVAAPALIASRPTPDRPAALADWPWVAHRELPQRRQLIGPDGQTEAIDVGPRVQVDHASALLRLVQAGAGAALIPWMLARDALLDGSAVRLLPGWRTESLGIYAVFPSRDHLAPKVSRFIELLAEHTARFFAVRSG